MIIFFFFFQAEDGIRDYKVTGVQTCALPICPRRDAVTTESGKRGGAPGRPRAGELRAARAACRAGLGSTPAADRSVGSCRPPRSAPLLHLPRSAPVRVWDQGAPSALGRTPRRAGAPSGFRDAGGGSRCRRGGALAAGWAHPRGPPPGETAIPVSSSLPRLRGRVGWGRYQPVTT